MKFKFTNTWIGIFFVGFAAYKSIIGDGLLDSVLYSSVGIGFILMDAVKNERFAPYKKILTILSWVFVLAGVLLFIALLRQDAYGI
jgi:hypothetical protein